MKNFQLKRLLSVCLFSAMIMSPSSFAFAAGTPVNPPKTKCFIEIQNAHISTSILEQQGRLAVKVNATSRCNVPQSEVVLTVKIFKEGFGAPHLVAQRSTRAEDPKSKGLLVRNQFTFAYCKNNTKSKYFGVASARAKIDGKSYFTPPTWSEKTLELECGT